MATLYVDAAVSPLFLAIEAGQRHAVFLADDARASDCLHVEVENLLSTLRLTPADIDTIIITRGPGSFTGIRVAYALAQSWQLAYPHVKLRGVGALHALYESHKTAIDAEGWQKTAVVSNAHGGQFYSALFSEQQATPPQSIDQQTLKTFMEEADGILVMADIDEAITTTKPKITMSSVTFNGMKQAAHKATEDISPLYVKPLTYQKVSST